MKCPQCGRVVEPSAKFCSNCGTQLREPSGDTTTVIPAVVDEHATELSSEDLEAVRGLSAGDALLIIDPGGSQSSRVLLNSDVTTVGRHPQSDVFLDNITVSRNHAKFIREGDQFFIEDLGSLNGTYVNRRLVDRRTRLEAGDEIQIGRFRATFSIGEAGLR